MAAFNGYCTVKSAGAQQGTVTNGKGKGRSSPIAPAWKFWLIACLLAALFTPSAALAEPGDWNLKAETIETHPTWIYTPKSTLNGSNKRGLMVVLHGCNQTHDQLKDAGNLERAADDHGLVMAVPHYVVPDDAKMFHPLPAVDVDCWDYDKALDEPHEHVKEIIALTRQLSERYNIDSNHIYVVGLSSGGALALELGCRAPDLFVGIGAIAGPSVGSDQSDATAGEIPSTNVPNAIKTCRSLASGKESFFANQIANIAYGNMDLNGPKALFWCRWRPYNPGENCVASIQWSKDNVDILKNIYNASDLGVQTNIQNGKGVEGVEQSATVAGRTRLSLLVIDNVGHAWPAGKGGDNDPNNQYVAQQGLNYPQYIAAWLIKNSNPPADGPPVVRCVDPAISVNRITLKCDASGAHTIKSYHVVVSGPSPQDETVSDGPNFSKQYTNLANGQYQATVTATDDQGAVSAPDSRRFSLPAEICVTKDNATHVVEGRAHACYWWWFCANGSNDILGFFGGTITSVKQTEANYWVGVDRCSGN